MRTYTVVPSFEGESANFDLPDIGFQGDHLSFAILFNLTELIEHWPDIVPSMIVTDQKGNTYIAPYTSWDPETHLFTWSISSTETTYDGNLLCQLKCVSADDPETIVCMSRICQTKVYPSLAAADNPPEAFQSWLDTLVLLGAQISEDAATAISSVEVSQNNALTAQSAAEDAESAKSAAQQAQSQASQYAQNALNSQNAAVQTLQRAQNAAASAETASAAAVSAKEDVEDELDEAESILGEVVSHKNDAEDAATRAQTYMTNAQSAMTAANNAKDAAVVAKGQAITAKDAAEAAEDSAIGAKEAAEASEDLSKKWAIGVGRDGTPVSVSDQTYHNNSKYWSDLAVEAKNEIIDSATTAVEYSALDESLTFVIGSRNILSSP